MTGYFVCAFRGSFHTFASLTSAYIRDRVNLLPWYTSENSIETCRAGMGMYMCISLLLLLPLYLFSSFLHFWFWLKACFALGLRVYVQSTGGERCFPFYYSVESVCAHTESRTSYTHILTHSRTHSKPPDMEIRFRVAHGIDGNVQDLGLAAPYNFCSFRNL